MKKIAIRPRNYSSLLILCILLPGLPLIAQDYFREIGMPGYYAPVQTIAPQEEENYNMAIGPVRLSVAAGVALEYNDNIELSDSNRKEDFILRPSLVLQAAWPISDLNTLRFSLGIGYAKYFSHSEFDSEGLLISPTSEIAFTMHVGPVKLTFRDRFTYQEDPYTEPLISGIGVFRRYENSASVQADWDVNEYLVLTGGYEHYNLWTVDQQFESLDRSVDTLFFKPGYRLMPELVVGLNTSFSWINYDANVQNDGTSWLVGPFVDWRITEGTHLYLEAGWQTFSFDNSGLIGDEDTDSWYVRSELNQRLTDSLSHRLAFTKTAEAAYGANYYDLYRVAYSLRWQATPSLIVDPSAFYEFFETSGLGGEEADRLGAALALRYILTPSVTLGADYRFLLKDSNLEGGDYRQNLAMLSLYYKF